MDRTHSGGDTQSIFASFLRGPRFHTNAATQTPRAGANAVQSGFLTSVDSRAGTALVGAAWPSPDSGAGAAPAGAAWPSPDSPWAAAPRGLSRRLPSGL